MQLLKISNFLNFHLKAFTQRRKAAKVSQRKAKEKNFAVTLRLCVFARAFAFLGSGSSGLCHKVFKLRKKF
jgi:hypothetical protein